MYAFKYHRPQSLDAAAAAFAAGEDARYLAGGMTLIPTMKQRLAAPSDLIDLSAIEGMRGIAGDSDTVTVKAMTTHAEVAASDIVSTAIPALAALAGGIGDPHVRNRGTLAGSIANNDPAADYPAAIVGLDATIRTPKREIAADEFFTEFFETALEPGELITEVVFQKPDTACYVKFANPASGYAIVGVMVARTGSAVRVAVTGAGGRVFRATAMEAALTLRFSPEAIADIAVAADDFNEDIHASAEYRAHLVGVIAGRAVAGCD